MERSTQTTGRISRFKDEFEWLSNFSPVKVKLAIVDNYAQGNLEGDIFEEYDSVELAYQAAKFLSKEIRDKIRRMKPGQAKRFSKAMHEQVRHDWHTVSLDIMKGLLIQKFRKGTELAFKLIGTGNNQLIEGNGWHDNFYGICYCDKCPKTGENHLGRLLMEIRRELNDTL